MTETPQSPPRLPTVPREASDALLQALAPLLATTRVVADYPEHIQQIREDHWQDPIARDAAVMTAFAEAAILAVLPHLKRIGITGLNTRPEPSVLETDIATLRAGADLLRTRSLAALGGDWQPGPVDEETPEIEWAIFSPDAGHDFALIEHEDTATFIATLDPEVGLLIADWLDGEAMSLGEMEPFADVINATFKAVSGNDVSMLQFGRDEHGNIAFSSSTIPASLRLARRLIGITEETPDV